MDIELRLDEGSCKLFNLAWKYWNFKHVNFQTTLMVQGRDKFCT